MLQTALGILIVLHGLVHLLYAGQSARLFELQPGMKWPDGSWLFARLFEGRPLRILAAGCCILADIGFTAGGLGVLNKQAWWPQVITGAAVFSTVLYIVFWDGVLKRLHDKGAVAVLINLAILAAIHFWSPSLGF